MTPRRGKATILVSASLAAILALAQVADTRAPLQPEALEIVGSFCHTGTVTVGRSEGNFVLEDTSGLPHFLFAQKQFGLIGLSTGDVVVAAGDCVRHDNGAVHESIRRIMRLGRKSLPPPEIVPLAELAGRKFLYGRVTTEGTLVFARRDEIDASNLQLLVKDDATVLNAAFIVNTNRPIDVTALLGARLRMTGAIMQSSGARKNAPYFLAIQPDGLVVSRPPPADMFDVPVLDLNIQHTPDEIVRMDSRRFDGVVLATWGGDQMMLEGRDFHRVKATLARSDELPEAGDCVTVVGFPDTDLYGINLIYARYKSRQVPNNAIPQPKPVDATLRQLLVDDHGRPRINGYSHGRLLRIKGTVLDVQPSLELFSLNEDGLTLPVDFSSSSDVASKLETNSKVEAVVLAVVETDSWRESIVLPQTRGLKLILRSADDLKVLERPPWWTPTRLTVVLISLMAAIVFIIAANRVINRIMMRRKVAERTRLAVELHDSLSQTLAGVACQIAAGHDAVADDPAAANNLLATAERMLESSRTELKNCLFDLRNDTVDDPDFERAIRRTLTGLKPEADISIRFRVARSLMTDSAAHAVLCIIRELAANAVRHGAATHIRVAGTADDGHLRFSVIDNGCGFDANHHLGPREGHFGLVGIRERLANLGGELALSSTPGTGTKVIVKLKTDNG